jgi:hypothetical protein
MQRRDKLNFLHSVKAQKTITLTNIYLHVQCKGSIIHNYDYGFDMSERLNFESTT